MNNINMLDFLMEHDVVLKCQETKNCMTADEAFELGGEFVVYNFSDSTNAPDLYRGTDFEEAVRILEGRKQDE